MMTEGKREKCRFAKPTGVKKETEFDGMWKKFIETKENG
jgi:hypothetical protein